MEQKQYRLTIEIDVWDYNPQDAARQGWRLLTGEGSSLPVMDVQEYVNDPQYSEPTRVDLEEIGMDPSTDAGGRPIPPEKKEFDYFMKPSNLMWTVGWLEGHKWHEAALFDNMIDAKKKAEELNA